MHKKSWKLCEVIGLVLILGSWLLEWQSVRKWSDAYNEYWKSITTINEAFYTAENRVAMQFELAINRSVQSINLDPNDFASAYKEAWKHDQIRKVWYEQSLLGIQRSETVLKFISRMSLEHGLRLSSDLDSLIYQQLQLSKKLGTLIDSNDPASQVIQIPGLNTISLVQAGKIKREISALVSALTEPLNELGKAMQSKCRSRSRYHAVLFTVGSLLLITAKLKEWFIEKKK